MATRTATWYELLGLGFEDSQGQNFLGPVPVDPEANPASCKIGVKRLGCSPLASGSGIFRAIHLPALYDLWACYRKNLIYRAR